MKIGNGLDLQKTELKNTIIHKLGSAPSSPVEGQLYYDTTDHVLYQYNGTGWIATDPSKVADGYISLAKLATNPLARANHTGTQTASTISDFDTQVRTNRLDQMSAPTSAVSMNSQKITNVADPTNPQDVATKAYTDSQAAGIDAKASCRVATTANITLSGTQTIDGISVIAGDRVLVKNQSTGSQNGIYVCAAGSWSRSTDCDSTAEYTTNAFVFIEEGTSNGGTQWKVSTTGSITVGTTSVTWVQWGAGSSYTAGTGIGISGNSISADLGTGLTLSSNSIVPNRTYVPFRYAQDVGDGSTTTYTITHNLGTRDVVVAVIENSGSYNAIITDWAAATTNTITLTFATAPTSNQYRVVVIG